MALYEDYWGVSAAPSLADAYHQPIRLFAEAADRLAEARGLVGGARTREWASAGAQLYRSALEELETLLAAVEAATQDAAGALAAYGQVVRAAEARLRALETAGAGHVG